MKLQLISILSLWQSFGKRVFYKMLNTCMSFVSLLAKDYWYQHAADSIQNAERLEQNTNVAKNLVFFLGDGMSISTVTAARILKGQQRNKSGEEGYLSWETFPHAALSKVGIYIYIYIYMTLLYLCPCMVPTNDVFKLKNHL